MSAVAERNIDVVEQQITARELHASLERALNTCGLCGSSALWRPMAKEPGGPHPRICRACGATQPAGRIARRLLRRSAR
jgi:NAD-dependent SIR2 family protein deacetylase